MGIQQDEFDQSNVFNHSVSPLKKDKYQDAEAYQAMLKVKRACAHFFTGSDYNQMVMHENNDIGDRWGYFDRQTGIFVYSARSVKQIAFKTGTLSQTAVFVLFRGLTDHIPADQLRLAMRRLKPYASSKKIYRQHAGR